MGVYMFSGGECEGTEYFDGRTRKSTLRFNKESVYKMLPVQDGWTSRMVVHVGMATFSDGVVLDSESTNRERSFASGDVIEFTGSHDAIVIIHSVRSED